MPKVSVIVPVYNADEYVEKAIRSVLSQTLKDLEILCIDDGSTDQSLQILESLSKEDGRIRLFYQDNHGLGYARNVGIEAAKGEYIHYLDADDYIVPETYEELVSYADANELDVVFFSSQVEYYDQELSEDYAWEKMVGKKKEIYPIDSGIKMLCSFVDNKDYNVISCLQMARRDFLFREKISFPHTAHEDLLYTFSLLIRAQRCGCLKKDYYQRLVHHDSQLTSPLNAKRLYGYFHAMQESYFIVEKMDLEANEYAGVKKTIDNLRYNIARIYRQLPKELKEEFLHTLNTSERLFFDLAVSQYMQKKQIEEKLGKIKNLLK